MGLWDRVKAIVRNGSAIGAAGVLLLAGGCAGGSGQSGSAARQGEHASDDDLSTAEWGEMRMRPSGSGVSGAGDAAPDALRPWTIVLATVAGENAQAEAQRTLLAVTRSSPELAGGTRLVPAPSGVMIAYGAYADVRDEQAQADLAWIKQIVVGRNRPYALAVLTRVSSATTAATNLHPNDLRSARQQYPKIDPLYTLQVGVWSDLESGALTPEQVRQSAERQAAQLRAQGHEAYFYHDVQKAVSLVTVGLFDRSAVSIDPALRTPVYSAEVEAMLKKFPEHQVNGERVLEPVAPRVPELGTRVQTPKLVIVPMQ